MSLRMLKINNSRLLPEKSVVKQEQRQHDQQVEQHTQETEKKRIISGFILSGYP